MDLFERTPAPESKENNVSLFVTVLITKLQCLTLSVGTYCTSMALKQGDECERQYTLHFEVVCNYRVQIAQCVLVNRAEEKYNYQYQL